jgi:hypothetical protein
LLADEEQRRMDYATLETSIARLDGALRPIANRPVDITKPDWLEKLRLSNPLDDAGIEESETHTLLECLVRFYAKGDEAQRASARALLNQYKSFAWAARLNANAATAEGFRLHLLHLAVCDQGRDARDTIVSLQNLCQVAGRAGVAIAPILTEVAALSSDADKYGMGSMRTLLLQAR